MTRQDRAIFKAIRSLQEGAIALRHAVRLRKLNEDAGPPMQIIVHNSGTGSAKTKTNVFNTQLKMDANGRPQLWFNFRESGGQPEYYADYTSEGWVADMD